jgi:hypothetical protein
LRFVWRVWIRGRENVPVTVKCAIGRGVGDIGSVTSIWIGYQVVQSRLSGTIDIVVSIRLDLAAWVSYSRFATKRIVGVGRSPIAIRLYDNSAVEVVGCGGVVT